MAVEGICPAGSHEPTIGGVTDRPEGGIAGPLLQAQCDHNAAYGALVTSVHATTMLRRRMLALSP